MLEGCPTWSDHDRRDVLFGTVIFHLLLDVDSLLLIVEELSTFSQV